MGHDTPEHSVAQRPWSFQTLIPLTNTRPEYQRHTKPRDEEVIADSTIAAKDGSFAKNLRTGFHCAL